ncbi:MAG: tungsten ABC transporter substrate-binding protein [Dehalococcoidales bacterium]|jgi:tungstate transport system substrate-binding protein|nr:tungsten ABC transporter substrate-binding protein [Dehalococcoidales bacterium]|tara:strand:- start:1923 stop:2792 length:870 start_codon:yes stop_codon:yes gene_type:complete
MKNKVFRSLAIVIALTSLITGMAGCKTSTAAPLPLQERLRVATTTSLYDTGLWGYLKPMFEEKYGAKLDVMYAGTGIALEYGRRGDVNIITIHSKSREDQFVAEGYGVERVPFAYNYFLIVGPESDPAGIKGMIPEDAFKKLMEIGSFISRGDDSGTHSKEKAIWEKADFDYRTVQKAGEWYIETGRGMGPTLLMASEKQAYTLSDIGTFLSYKGKIELTTIVDKGDILLNVYSAIAINPERHPKANIEMASNLIDFLTSPEIQKLIGGYGVEEYGRQLFIPCAGAEPK